MNQIQALIINAVTTSNNNQFRKQAQQTLFTLFTCNPTDFFQNCAFLITDISRPDVNRQAVASVMKALLQKKTDKNQFYWDAVEPSKRPDIKTCLFNNLVSENRIVMRAGANVIAGIAAIENPRGQWLDLINMLASNTRHQSQNIRIASLTTLGYICEELKNSRINFNDNVCEQILGGIINGLRQTEQIAQISLQAIRDSIHFLAPILENYSYMNETFNAIQFLLSNDLGNKAYEVLFEIGKICYFLLSPFLQRLCKITIQHIKSRSVLSERAMQFWDTVATEYLIRSERNTENAYELASPVPNYILQVYSLLVTQIMSCMLITSNIDLEHPELREASVRALTSIVGCCGRQVVDVIVEGVEKIIASPLDGQRQAAVLLFSCLSDHNDRKIIKQMFQRWFQRLQSLIGDSSQIVRKNTLNGFIALSQSYPEVFIDHQQQYVFQNLLELTSHTNEDFSSLALSILYNITQYFDNNQYNNKPFPKAKLYIQFLLTRFFEDNPQRTIKYMQTIVEIAINMLTLITDDQSQAELLKFLINKYYTVNFQKILIITNILYTISSLLVRIRKNNCLLDGMLQDFNIFINDLLKRMGCSYHTFQVIGACSFLCEKKFSKISLNQNYWKCTEQGLNRYDDPILFKATMICLGDVVRNNNGKYSSKIIAISKRLIDSIHANIPYSHKYLVLRFISDFCIGLGQYAETFLDKILAICTQCFNAVYILQCNKLYDTESENQREHAVILKDAIVDMYHAMACNINKAGKVNLKLANHFATLSTFIVITCQQRQNPNLNYLRECVMLLFDCSIIYLNNKTIAPVVREIIYSEQIKIIINTLKLHSNCPKIQDTLQFVSTVYQKF